jgi:hypothetical protein
MNIALNGTPEEMWQFLSRAQPSSIAPASPTSGVEAKAAAGAAALPLAPSGGTSEVSRQVQEAARSNYQTLLKVQTMLAVHDNILGPENYDIEHMQQWIARDVKWVQFGKTVEPPGLEGVQRAFSAFAARFKFVKLRTLLAFGQDEYLGHAYELIARHVGEFMDRKPTHKNISVHGNAILRISNGIVTEYYDAYDIPGILPQLDMMGAKSAHEPERGQSIADTLRGEH